MKRPAQRRQLGRRRQHQRLIASDPPNCGIADLVIPWSRVNPHLRNHHGRAVVELHHRRHIENVLIVSRKQERLAALDRASDGRAKLMLLIAGIETHKWRRSSRQFTVAQMIERATVPMVRARFRHHIHHRAPSPPRLRSITARLHAKLLDHLVRKLVGRTIPSRCLRIEPVVVVTSVHQKARVVSPNPAIRKIPIRSRSQPARILGHARRQQQQIGEPPPIERQILDCPLIYERRYRTRVRIRHPRSLRHHDRFLRPRHLQLEGQLRCHSDLHSNHRRNFRRHPLRLRPRRILPRRQQIHHKPSRRIRGREVADPRLHPDGNDVRGRNRRSLRVHYHSPQRARGRILPPSRSSNKDELEEEYAEDNYRKNTTNCNYKQLTAAAHTNPLVSKTSESEGIPETLLICIPPCISLRV